MAPNRQSIASVIRSLSFEDVASASAFVTDAKHDPLTLAPEAAPPSEKKRSSTTEERSEEAAASKKAAARREEAVEHAEAFFAWPEEDAAERRRKKEEEAKERAEEVVSAGTIEAILAKDVTAAAVAPPSSSSSEKLRRSDGAPDADFDYWNWESQPAAHRYKEEEGNSEESLLLRYAEDAGCPVGTDHGYHHGCYHGEVYDSWEEGMEGTAGLGMMQAERDGYWYM